MRPRGGDRGFRGVDRKLFALAGVGVAILVTVGSFAAMHVAAAYLQKGDDLIRSVQARYFYPAFLLLAIIPFTRKFTTSKRVYIKVVVIGSIALLATQAIAIAIAYQWL